MALAAARLLLLLQSESDQRALLAVSSELILTAAVRQACSPSVL
jgi:hypothetical protein